MINLLFRTYLLPHFTDTALFVQLSSHLAWNRVGESFRRE